MDGISWEIAFSSKEAEEILDIFKDIFLRVQELSIPTCKKLGNGKERPVWLSQDFLMMLKFKKNKNKKKL